MINSRFTLATLPKEVIEHVLDQLALLASDCHMLGTVDSAYECFRTTTRYLYYQYPYYDFLAMMATCRRLRKITISRLYARVSVAPRN